MEECQDKENHCALQGWADTAERYHSKGKRMKSHVEDADVPIGRDSSDKVVQQVFQGLEVNEE